MFIPAAEAMIGSVRGLGRKAEHKLSRESCECDPEWLAWEQPIQKVRIAAFCMDTTEVTVADYARCMQAGACPKPRTDQDSSCKACNLNQPDHDHHPVNGVSFTDSRTYCAWVKKSLPTGEQWEYAARGPKGSSAPWGDESPSTRVMSDAALRGEALGQQPVGSYPAGASVFGVLDLLGSLSEWTLPEWKGGMPTGLRRGYIPGRDSHKPIPIWTTTWIQYDSGQANLTDGFRCVAESLP